MSAQPPTQVQQQQQQRTKVQECSICLQPAQARQGFEFLVSPGCCGNWFHQNCLNDFISKGGKDCPLCRTAFPATTTAAAAAAAAAATAAAPPAAPPTAVATTPAPAPPLQVPPPLQQQQQVQQQLPPPPQQAPQTSFWSNLFGMGRSTHNVGSNPPPPPPQQQQPSISNRRYQSASPMSNLNRQFQASKLEDEELLLEESALEAVEPTKPREKGKKLEREPNVTLSITPEYRTMALNAKADFFLKATLEFQDLGDDEDLDRSPLDVICVLDDSGSMSGSKIFSLKKAMEFVVSVLGERDRLSVVTFNSSARVRQVFKRCTAERKTKMRDELIPSINAGGGTSIHDGLLKGYNLLNGRQTRNGSSVLFLLTDGQDTDKAKEQCELASRIRAEGSAVFIFGFGADHDSAHLQRLAKEAEATFIYIDKDDQVVDAFGGAIGSQQGLALNNVVVDIEFPAGVIPRNAQSGNYANTVSANHISVRYTDLYIGERRDLVMCISVPEVPASIDFLTATGHATYMIRGSDMQLSSSPVTCFVRRVQGSALTAADNERDAGVDVEICRLRTTAAIANALSLADSGKIDDARKALEAEKETLSFSISYREKMPLALSLMTDLEDCLKRVQSRAEYERSGGRAQMSEYFDSYSNQRNVYSKAATPMHFQSKRSATSQVAAFKSKGPF